MTNHQRWLLLKILPYTLIAFVSAIVYWTLEIGLLGTDAIYPFTENVVYNPSNSFIGVTITAIILGTGLGIIEETFFKTKFKSRSFLTKIVLKTLIYVTLLLLLLCIQSLILNGISAGKSVFHKEVINTVFNFFSSLTLLGVMAYSGFMIALALFSSEIIDYLGIDIVSSFFTGKYNKSVNEERIFMFLDMKDSTTIAEKLGHENHYEFINEYYGDMTDPIIATKGRIYQYVGDEIVLSWSLAEGLHQSNCLNSFYLIKTAIQNKKEVYKNKYGIFPEFKAGMHYGKVTRGRVGAIKKDLLFTGDVLNTTARIQHMCKELKADFLISNTLRELIKEADLNFGFVERGSFSLRGRKKEETLVEIRLLSNQKSND